MGKWTFQRRYATAFLADQQLADVLDTLSLAFYQGKDTATIQNGFIPKINIFHFIDVINVVIGSLTGTQLMQGLTIYNSLTKDLGGSDATAAIISTVFNWFNEKLKYFSQIDHRFDE